MRVPVPLLSPVRLTLFSVLALTSLLSTVSAQAEAISFYNTGIAADGSMLAAGASDPHYTLLYSSDSSGFTATATNPNGAWATAPDAGWISPGVSGDTNWSSGYYVYEATLDLTGVDPSAVTLSGQIAADDQVYIYLNRGGDAVFSSTGFSTLIPFTVNSGFLSGMNEVDFVVVNGGGPTGLLVSDARAVTPEPGSIVLLGTGLIGSVGAMARKFRSKRV